MTTIGRLLPIRNRPPFHHRCLLAHSLPRDTVTVDLHIYRWRHLATIPLVVTPFSTDYHVTFPAVPSSTKHHVTFSAAPFGTVHHVTHKVTPPVHRCPLTFSPVAAVLHLYVYQAAVRGISLECRCFIHQLISSASRTPLYTELWIWTSKSSHYDVTERL